MDKKYREKTMKAFLLFTILLFTVTQVIAQNNAPEVTNVTFNQRTDGSYIVDIYYDLNDADGDTMFVTMQVSEDSGATWNFTCDSTSGDIGDGILSGTSKHIIWDFGGEHPQTFGDAFRISVIANDRGLKSGIVTDIDGNVYQTVKIGNQWWMAENLKVTHYSNGDSIPHVINDSTWGGPYTYTGAYCAYDNNSNNVSTYGLLYNWLAVDDSRNIAPAGWHVPTDDEWHTLVDYLGGDSVAGGKMKTTGTIQGGDGLWVSPNTGATNSSGFSALPGGFRFDGGEFSRMSDGAYFWSSTEYGSYSAWYRLLYYCQSFVDRNDGPKPYGFSVRLVRD